MVNKIKFEDITIDTKEISQSLLDIDERHRTSLFTWNGQFSPQFIEVMLRQYASEGDIVYDPFAGSGTVVDESIRLGLGSQAAELNPAAYHMARVREYSAFSAAARTRICREVEERIRDLNSDDLENEIALLYGQSKEEIKDAIALLVVLCDIYKHELTKERVLEKWNALAGIIRELPKAKYPVKVVRSDARCVPFDDNSADLVITSPPYINVMNYHQQYRRSVELLGYEILKIAKSEFGANRLNRGNRFLTVIEYAIDICLSLKESSRILKPDARMIYVVGKESKVLGQPFSNSEIVWRVATEVLGLNFVLKQQRKFKNRFGKLIYEDILHFSNSECQKTDESKITNQSREIARQVLEEARATTTIEETRIKLLEAAIANYDKVERCQ